ncbi:hypothetical protein BCF53_12342 [Reinekea marinisedimentorum]|uniref:Uncharacterized protein n=1 Tax=Reinekea marinisedimentorum TaxID=230495 RepID=A0A4R3HUJ3_9GAMM|nr:hypothetical protein BCF53_12342 [Reinekea marinisedimentorum]
MSQGLFFAIWYVVALVVLMYLNTRLIRNVKSEYKGLWHGLLLVKPERLNEKGLRLRRIAILFIFIYLIGGVLVLRTIY